MRITLITSEDSRVTVIAPDGSRTHTELVADQTHECDADDGSSVKVTRRFPVENPAAPVGDTLDLQAEGLDASTKL